MLGFYRAAQSSELKLILCGCEGENTFRTVANFVATSNSAAGSNIDDLRH
jgi:hypothetical protein